jgi:hypothetical protein
MPDSSHKQQSALSPFSKQRPGRPKRSSGRPPKHDVSTWTITNDWPEQIPVSDAEVDVFEQCFGDLLDDLFGPGDLTGKLRP